eukprot:TRINITY_DN3369_c0_g3_i6.p1 TRINITY_DN3369_c0_g3~~TRINITY_DN3369_c0_g3_i6.p1  ORF type:complete len:464 (+),score=86.50 TRINITY_DN3369_c0_g3_i6:371-1762(+)
MKRLSHPNVIRLVDVVHPAAGGYVCLVLEYCPGGELFDYLVQHGKLPEPAARRFFQQIICGVEYCHSHMVVHRDLKPENLLLDGNGNVKIADFGLSTMMHDGDFLATSCGSPNYAAPEVISGKLYAGPEVDVWSCGVILYTLLAARLPFDDDYIPNLFNKIRAGLFDMPHWLSPACRQLLASMLVVDPLRRITVAEIRTHPWFQQDLPRYLRVAAQPVSGRIEHIDEAVLAELLDKFHVDRAFAVEQLQGVGSGAQDSNAFIVAYHLILDQRVVPRSEAADNGPDTDLPATPSDIVGSPLAVRLDNQQSARQQGGGGWAASSYDDELRLLEAGGQRLVLGPGAELLDAAAGRKMWYLGMASNLPSSDIMRDAYRVLKMIGARWKTVTPFHLRCTLAVGGERSQVKFALQLFSSSAVKVGSSDVGRSSSGPSNRYLLDIRKLEGETFPFLDVCSTFLLNLKTQP